MLTIWTPSDLTAAALTGSELGQLGGAPVAAGVYFRGGTGCEMRKDLGMMISYLPLESKLTKMVFPDVQTILGIGEFHGHADDLRQAVDTDGADREYLLEFGSQLFGPWLGAEHTHPQRSCGELTPFAIMASRIVSMREGVTVMVSGLKSSTS